jgi:acyl carrier protein
LLWTTKRRIRRHINRELLEGSGQRPRDALAAGALDSLALEELVAYLEDRYGIVFTDDEFVAENFSSTLALASLVEAKRKLTKAPEARVSVV